MKSAPITGKRTLTLKNIAGDDLTVSVRQIPVRLFDDFSALLGAKKDGQAISAGAQAHGFVKLFTTLDDDVIDEIDHASIDQIVAAGLEMNSGFFVSYPATLQKGMAGVIKAGAEAVAAQSVSTGGSTNAASPAAVELKSAST